MGCFLVGEPEPRAFVDCDRRRSPQRLALREGENAR
jgi:hypothetical protein